MKPESISLLIAYINSLRKPVRNDVESLFEGANIASVSADGLLAYRMICHLVYSESAGNNVQNQPAGIENQPKGSSASASPQDSMQMPGCSAAAVPAATAAEPHRGERYATPNQPTTADTAAQKAAESACETPAATADAAAQKAAESAPAVAEMPAEPIAAVRCQERPEVLLDLEQLQPDELRVLMPQVRREQVDALMPEAEFRRGATVEGVSAELLADEVLDVRPRRSTANDVDARYDEMMERVRRLADSRRCLLFEQVRAVTEYDMDDAIFRTVYKQYRTPEKRAHFLALSRSERLHVVARVWVWRSNGLKAMRRNGIRQL